MRSVYLILITSIFFSATISAQDAGFKTLAGTDKDAFKNSLYASSEKINTLECSFIQKQHLSLLAEELASKGNMTFKKPDQLLWVYNAPYEFVFLMDKGKITTKSDGKVSTFDSGSSPLMKELCKIMIAGLKGDTKSLETSFVTSYYTNGPQVRVTMSPKNKNLASIFKKIDLLFDAKTYLVSSIDMAEPSGDNTIILINNIKINSQVNDAVFNIH